MQPHEFWQRIEAPGTLDVTPSHAYSARFDDGRVLLLPIRPLAHGEHALASLILNQASFDVVEAIAADLAEKLQEYLPEVVVGLPTLGLTLASAVARKLGHSRYVPLGTSRKFWYREELSVPLTSITTPEHTKRLYLDPRMANLLQDRRVALIDDVVSSGASMAAALELMRMCGVEPAVLGAAMLQSDRWIDRLGVPWTGRIVAVLKTPILSKSEGGRWIDPALPGMTP